MESFISEGEPETDKRSGSENGTPASAPFPNKALPWCVVSVFVAIAVVFTRASIPPMEYMEDVALVSIPRFTALLFQICWFALFFLVLRKIHFWGSGTIFTIFFLPAALSVYLRNFYGVEIDYRLVIDCINTHWEEAQAFFSLHAVSTLLGFIALMFAGAWVLRKTPAKLPRSKILVAILVFVLAFLANLPSLRVYIFPVKITLDVVHSLQRYYNGDKLKLEELARKENDPQDVSTVPSTISHVNALPIVVLHIGETARADHAPFNGYARNTMPNMLREYEEGNLVSFPKCVSFANGTTDSMRGILTPSTVLNNAFQYPTFIPALNQSGVETCGFCSSFHAKYCTYDVWLGQMLGKLQEIICTPETAPSLLPKIREKIIADAKKNSAQGRFYFYYGEGSHKPFTFYDYNRHAVFKPNGKRKYNDERDLNNYDNTFIAVDEFCGGFIDMLREEDAVYIFVGDHGEMLGEDGFQGRPNHRKEVRHVLFFVWVSEKFKKENPELWRTLLSNRERLDIVSHDFVYNSILHLFSLKTPFYDDKTDLFSDSAEPFPVEIPDVKNSGARKPASD